METGLDRSNHLSKGKKTKRNGKENGTKKEQKMLIGSVKNENNLSIGRRFFAGGRSYKDGSGTQTRGGGRKGKTLFAGARRNAENAEQETVGPPMRSSVCPVGMAGG